MGFTFCDSGSQFGMIDAAVGGAGVGPGTGEGGIGGDKGSLDGGSPAPPPEGLEWSTSENFCDCIPWQELNTAGITKKADRTTKYQIRRPILKLWN